LYSLEKCNRALNMLSIKSPGLALAKVWILFSLTISRTSSFVLHSVHLTFIIFLHSHTSNALITCYALTAMSTSLTHIILPLHIKIFISCFFRLSPSLLHRSLLFLKASFPDIMRLYISLLFYLFKFYSINFDVYFASFLPAYPYHLFFFRLIFIPCSSDVLFRLFIILWRPVLLFATIAWSSANLTACTIRPPTLTLLGLSRASELESESADFSLNRKKLENPVFCCWFYWLPVFPLKIFFGTLFV